MSCKVYSHDAACTEREGEIFKSFSLEETALNAPPTNGGIGDYSSKKWVFQWNFKKIISVF